MALAVKILIWAVVSVGLGVMSALWVIDGSFGRAGIAIAPWQTNPLIGSAQADPYLRAAIAKNGLLALGREETVYYSAAEDSDGAPLDGRCQYEIVGPPLPARWWSITLYGADQYLVPHPAEHYAFGSTDLLADDDALFRVQAGPDEASGFWLATPPDGPFSLTLRLYNPAPAVTEDLRNVELPVIEKTGCPA